MQATECDRDSGQPRASTERKDRGAVREAMTAPDSSLSSMHLVQRTCTHHDSPQIMVWGVLSFDSLLPLAVIYSTLTAQRHIDDIPLLNMLPFLLQHAGLTFQHDNAWSHTALAAMNCLQAFPTIPWTKFVEWAKNEIAVVPDFHKRILFSDEAHFWLNGYVNKQNCRIWSEANPQVYVETPLHPEKLTVWCALWAGGILLQKR
ncbi:hypothetical protein TNCV_843771 [Trichonephila clavipes]|nr:hypothetical protein TNCV_843771 [Trichonephila clavipes]